MSKAHSKGYHENYEYDKNKTINNFSREILDMIIKLNYDKEDIKKYNFKKMSKEQLWDFIIKNNIETKKNSDEWLIERDEQFKQFVTKFFDNLQYSLSDSRNENRIKKLFKDVEHKFGYYFDNIQKLEKRYLSLIDDVVANEPVDNMEKQILNIINRLDNLKLKVMKKIKLLELENV